MNTIDVSLSEFLRTGELGPIRRGLSQEKILDLLGPPEDQMITKTYGKSPAWLYGSIELGFDIPDETSSSLNYIQIERIGDKGRFQGYRHIDLHDDGFLPRASAVDDFKNFARKSSIEFKQISPPWLSDENLLLLTQGNIGVWFTWDSEAQKFRFDTFITETYEPYGAED